MFRMIGRGPSQYGLMDEEQRIDDLQGLKTGRYLCGTNTETVRMWKPLKYQNVAESTGFKFN